jgi:hypothetical protein
MKQQLDRVRNDEVKVCPAPNCVKSFMCYYDYLEQHQIKGDHQKESTRFTFKQLKYIYDAFMVSEKTGQKSTPEYIVMKMRCLRSNSKKTFMQNEYLRASS